MELPLMLALLSTVWTATAMELEPVVVELGTKFMFPCRSPIDGNTSDLVWMKNGVKLVTGKRYTVSAIGPHHAILLLDRVEVNDNGTVFACFGPSRSGASINISVQLIVLAPGELPRGYPMIDSGASGSRVRYLYSGDVIRLPCNAHGNPTPHVMWYKDSIPIDRDGKRFSHATSNHLHIRNVQPEDSGIYKCSAFNVHGTFASTPFEVHVLEQGTVKVSSAIFYTPLLCCILIFVAGFFLLRWARRYVRMNRSNRRVIAEPPPDYDSVDRMNVATHDQL